MIQKKAKGKLIVIGGGQDLSGGKNTSGNTVENLKRFEILMKLIPKKKSHEKKHIEIITTASTEPHKVNKTYLKAFKKIGFYEVGFIFVGTHPEADNPKYIDRINKAHAVLFSGGDQFRLSTILGNTDVLEAVRKRYMIDSDFIVAGSSAGAMAMPEIMLIEGDTNDEILNLPVKISSGFGLIEHCIIDTHFLNRGRFERLSEAVVMNPGFIGIGIGEKTALLIKEGNHAECLGSGVVIIMDGKDVGHTNIAFAEEGEALCIENLRVHMLSDGNGYLLNERKFVPSKKDISRLLRISEKKKTVRSPEKEKHKQKLSKIKS